MVLFGRLHVTSHGKHASFEMRNAALFLPIALRRTILMDVPTVAVAFDPYDDDLSDITIKQNTGCLHNEWLAHRLSLIPIHFSRDEIDEFDPERYEFRIQAQASVGSSGHDVTTRDIHVSVDGKNRPDLARRLFPPDPSTKEHVLLTRLRSSNDSNSREVIDITFRARRGTGMQHARWMPASKAVYRYDLQHPDVFQFDVESECGMSPCDIVAAALDVLHARIQKVALAVREGSLQPRAADDDTSILELDSSVGARTLGPYIQAGLLQLAPGLQYVGVAAQHPLQEHAHIKFRGGREEMIAGLDRLTDFTQQARLNFAKACSGIKDAKQHG